MLRTDPPALALTGRGRVRAILVTLEARWDTLSREQQAHALDLLAELSAAIRTREVAAIRSGEVPVRAG